jgi:hypothetical protein
MPIHRSSYNGLDWLGALKAANKPRDPSVDVGATPESEVLDNALESTAALAFDLPVSAESKQEALVRSSREIADAQSVQMKRAAADEIRQKLATNEIDPIALKVSVREPNGVVRAVTKEEWEGSTDARFVEKIATAAVLEVERQQKQSWQNDAMQPAQHLSSKYNPETMRDGKIMSSTAAGEDSISAPGRVPANAASLLDPNRLDNFINTENAHDASVRASRESQAKREAERQASLAPDESTLIDTPMSQSQVIRAGGLDRDIFAQRVPSNRVSMKDTVGQGKLTSEELKSAMSNMFSRIEDRGISIREANESRREEIQGKKAEKDRSWETLAKPMSTSSIVDSMLKSLMEKKK